MRRTIAGIIAGLLAGASLAVMTAGPASAGNNTCAGNATNAPDGRIRFAGGDWVGGNNYPFASETAALDPGQVQQYELQWRNRGNDFLTIRVKLAHIQNGGYGFKFFAYGLNVSKEVRQGQAIVFQHVPAGKRSGVVTVLIRDKASTSEAEAQLYGFYGGNPNPTVNCDALLAQAND